MRYFIVAVVMIRAFLDAVFSFFHCWEIAIVEKVAGI